jgi:hypothetical protein
MLEQMKSCAVTTYEVRGKVQVVNTTEGSYFYLFTSLFYDTDYFQVLRCKDTMAVAEMGFERVLKISNSP